MNRPEQKTPLSPESDDAQGLAGEKKILEKPENVCHLCHAKMVAGEEKILGIWKLCDACYKDMNASTKAPESDSGQIEDEQPEDDDVEEFVRVDMNKTIPCASCSRLILEIAAKEHDGKALCPDCYYKLEGKGASKG